jgi:hypothetical protein
MTRQDFLRLACAALAPSLGLPIRGQSARSKNVLLLMSDQHRRDCLGKPDTWLVNVTPFVSARLRLGAREFGSPLNGSAWARGLVAEDPEDVRPAGILRRRRVMAGRWLILRERGGCPARRLRKQSAVDHDLSSSA